MSTDRMNDVLVVAADVSRVEQMQEVVRQAVAAMRDDAGRAASTLDGDDIARVATFGAVDTAIVDIDDVVPGSVDEESGAVTLAEAADDLYLSALVEIGLVLFIITLGVNVLSRAFIWSLGRQNQPRRAGSLCDQQVLPDEDHAVGREGQPVREDGDEAERRVEDEQCRDDADQKIARPRQIYTGAKRRDERAGLRPRWVGQGDEAGRRAAINTIGPALLMKHFLPLLAVALPHVGHFQTRNKGTVCGSVAHADPSSEIPLSLATLEGEVVLAYRRPV